MWCLAGPRGAARNLSRDRAGPRETSISVRRPVRRKVTRQASFGYLFATPAPCCGSNFGKCDPRRLRRRRRRPAMHTVAERLPHRAASTSPLRHWPQVFAQTFRSLSYHRMETFVCGFPLQACARSEHWRTSWKKLRSLPGSLTPPGSAGKQATRKIRLQEALGDLHRSMFVPTDAGKVSWLSLDSDQCPTDLADLGTNSTMSMGELGYSWANFGRRCSRMVCVFPISG